MLVMNNEVQRKFCKVTEPVAKSALEPIHIFMVRGFLLHPCYLSTWFSHRATVWMMGQALGTQSWTAQTRCRPSRGLWHLRRKTVRKTSRKERLCHSERPSCQLLQHCWGAGNSSQWLFQITKGPSFFASRRMVINLNVLQGPCFCTEDKAMNTNHFSLAEGHH